MAIIDGKRHRGWYFYKVRGKKQWVAYSLHEQELWGLCADIEEGTDPMKARFHYCSPISQPVFLDSTHHPGWPSREHYVDSSWKKMPEEWRQIFRRDIFGGR